MSGLGVSSFDLRTAWRPWRVGASIRRFVMGWVLVTMVFLEVLDWVWPAPAAVLPPVVWLLVKLLFGAVVLMGVMRQAFLPVRTLGRSLNALPLTELKAVAQRQPAELLPLATAVNRVLQSQQTAIDEQGKFLANASHQLQTPVCSVAGAVARGDVRGHDCTRHVAQNAGHDRSLQHAGAPALVHCQG